MAPKHIHLSYPKIGTKICSSLVLILVTVVPNLFGWWALTVSGVGLSQTTPRFLLLCYSWLTLPAAACTEGQASRTVPFAKSYIA